MKKQTVKTIFRLYQTEHSNWESTFFDLIDGERETKQTKGLAYLFNLSPELLRKFFLMEKIRNSIKRICDKKQIFNSDFIKIDAEMTSEGREKVRRDITLTFYLESKKIFVLVIEAKSIKLVKNNNMEDQLQKYIAPIYFPKDEHVPKIVVALTKYEQLFRTPLFVSITWMDMIQVLRQLLQVSKDSTKSLIIKDYYQFITGVDKDMHYYEKEILSVPAGKTFNEITKHHIHACPISYNYRSSLFITFRQKGGVMDKLYKVVHIMELDPKDYSVIPQIENLEVLFKDRILSYLKDRQNGYGFNHDSPYRFYILSETEHISLPHRPHPEINNTGPRYYTLSEMLSGKEVVLTENQLEKQL